MIEIIKICIVAFMKARNSLDGENVFFKAFAKNLLLTLKICS